MAEAPIEVAPYDARWPAAFEQERALLAEALGPWLAGPPEHIGSTAVPGLAAKPVIDIMAPVHTLAASRPAIEAARELGYVHYPYKPDVMHWFCKPSAAHRTHHLRQQGRGGQLVVEVVGKEMPAMAARLEALHDHCIHALRFQPSRLVHRGGGTQYPAPPAAHAIQQRRGG